MEFSFNQVKGLLDEIRPFLLKGKLNAKRCSMPTGETNLIPAEKYIEVFDWLCEILKSAEWLEVQKVWKLLPPNIWAGYEMFEFEDLAEQKLLNAAIEKLKGRWRIGRPTGFFGRNLELPDESSESSDPDSDGTSQADVNTGI